MKTVKTTRHENFVLKMWKPKGSAGYAIGIPHVIDLITVGRHSKGKWGVMSTAPGMAFSESMWDKNYDTLDEAFDDITWYLSRMARIG